MGAGGALVRHRVLPHTVSDLVEILHRSSWSVLGFASWSVQQQVSTGTGHSSARADSRRPSDLRSGRWPPEDAATQKGAVMKRIAVVAALAVGMVLVGLSSAQPAQAATSTKTVRYGPFTTPPPPTWGRG